MPPKTSAAKTAPPHASYHAMITDAITNLRDRNGSSRQSLKKYVKANNKITISDKMFDSLFNKALKAGVDKGLFEQPKGYSGGTKLAKKSAAKKSETKKETEPKKPAGKKAAPKKAVAKKEATTAKKPAATKKAAPKKATAPKKPAAPKKTASASEKVKTGRVAKKPAAKKAAPKKAATPKKAAATKA